MAKNNSAKSVKRNTVSKIDNNVKKALSMVSAEAENIVGFCGFRHTAVWHDFPGSLRIQCQFDSEQALQQALADQQEEALQKRIHKALLKVGIVAKDIRKNVELSLKTQD